LDQIKQNTATDKIRFPPSIQPVHLRLQTILFSNHFPNPSPIFAQTFSSLTMSYKPDIALEFLTKLLTSFPSI